MMRISKNNQLKFGVILSYVQMFVNILIGVFYTPFVIRFLGQNEYGLYNTVSSTIAMLSLLKFGFNSSYIRFYSKYKSAGKNDKIESLNGLYIIIFVVMGLVSLVCGFFMLTNIEFIFGNGLSTGEYEIARKLMQLLIISMALSFPMGVFTNIISAHEEFVFLKLLELIKVILTHIIIIPILMMGFRSIMMASVTLIFTIILDVCYLHYVISKLKVKFAFKNFEKGLFKSMIVFSSFIAINTIVDQINWNIDKVLIARYSGTVEVAIYSVGYTLYSYYQMISSSVSAVFIPRVHKIVTSFANKIELRKSLTDLFVKIGRIQFLLLGLIATGLIFFGKQFIMFWVGDGYSVSYYIMVVLVVCATTALVQNVGIEIQRALNKHKFRSILYLFMAILNLISSIFLCRIWGAVGAVIGTGASLVLANGIIMNIYYHKVCYINIICFWKNILKMALGLIIPIVFGCLLVTILNLTNIFVFLFGILLYTVVYGVSMWCISMNDYEKDLIKKPLYRIIKRSK